ncbi:helix-turn-helix domain-containing protein [Clostridium perfringens]|uniref:helix-turn-helix domain-containing protein n=1 Tax=Clostridium perfringens TaxID=1502 RepID=UPI001D9BDA16|nr:helix-turn-helix transcriptional regulator [Clostridium perfringens]EGT2192653.1 helix-turn-helix domain-containing protein [Clostridium perfringens]EHK2365060.1 helix-turn-helix transcriptional regulator [Clostridium perfringens]MDU6457321.1 helix-turn-helix transcriptional regulator [Clostridium perfringens]MDZ5019827.1 helix-turn-helix domain-containing protein [Clostridium perfringens]
MNIGTKIRVIRKNNKMTQKELAAKSGVSEISIRNYENNKRNPKYETLEKIAIALETPINEFNKSFTGSNEDTIKKLINSMDIKTSENPSEKEIASIFILKDIVDNKDFYCLKTIMDNINFDIDSLSEKEQKEIYKKILEYVQFEIFKLTNSKEK